MMITSKRAWEVYPAGYRAEAMRQLAGWIQAGESGSIIGLAGAGKSNLLGFLSHRPEVMAQYLPPDSPKLALVQVDLNNLPNQELATFYRVMLRSLHETAGQFTALDPALAPLIETLYRKVEDKTDPFLSQSALREALLILREQAIRTVLVIDPFDQFCQTTTTQVLDNLRGLRDSFKTSLSYLIGLRHELAYIRDPLELGELYEILDTHQCWLGPMEADDARWVISQVEAASGQTLTRQHIGWLAQVSGGYPALLRAASLWLIRQIRAGAIRPDEDLSRWQAALRAEAAIQNRLNELRLGLTGEEEAALSVLQTSLSMAAGRQRQESLRQVEEKHQPALERLKIKGLCRPTSAGWQIFSPLFANFIGDMPGVSGGKIWKEPLTARFFQGETELATLSDKDRRLLEHFLDRPLTLHTIDELIETAWPEDDSRGVSDAAVQQAIRHLRKQIEPNPAHPCYLINERGLGYRFFAEGAPRK